MATDAHEKALDAALETFLENIPSLDDPHMPLLRHTIREGIRRATDTYLAARPDLIERPCLCCRGGGGSSQSDIARYGAK